MKEGRIFKDRIKEIVPKKYHNYGGIGPYYLPFFGTMYWNRLRMALRLILNTNTQEDALAIGDIGSGFGIFTAIIGDSFPKSKIVGLDMEAIDTLVISKSISNMYNVQNTSFVQADACMCPFSGKKFDILFALDVLEHVPDPLNALFELKRILKENGILIISVPLEPKILVLTRRLYSLVSGGCTNPHWNGTIKSFEAFCEHVEGFGKIEKKVLFPIDLLGKNFNYDCFFVCRNK